MSTEGDALYSNDLLLLTLKGHITVHFMDGHTLEGKIATQDAYNIFLTVDGEPLMIPRSQIRYIRGEHSQQIEKDMSQGAFFGPESERTDAYETKMPKTAEMNPPPELQPEHGAEEAEYDSDDGGTFVLDPETGEYFSDQRETSDSGLETAENMEDTGLTFVLDETATFPDETEVIPLPEDDLEEATVLLDQAEEQVSARLICTGGPHADKMFELDRDLITLGRATDNDCSLPEDKEISRRHAIIMREADRYLIQDQNSLNGTFVNEERIEGAHYLENGDIIMVGVSYLEFLED